MKHIIYIVFFLISLCPIQLLFLLSKLLSKLNIIIKYRFNVSKKNIKTSFPKLKDSQANEILKKFYDHLFNVIIEIIKSLTFNRNNILERVKINNLSQLQKSIQNKKNIVVICAHYNNWEWLFLRLSLIEDINLNAIYQKLSNKYFNEIIIRIRTKFGAKIIPLKEWKKFLLNQKNRRTCLFVADQVPSKPQEGIRLNFLNKSTLFHVSPEKTAKLLNAEVYYTDIKNIKKGYYSVNLIRLYSHNITQEYAQLLEKTIKKQPQYWLWSHKRWKR